MKLRLEGNSPRNNPLTAPMGGAAAVRSALRANAAEYGCCRCRPAKTGCAASACSPSHGPW